MFLIRLILVSFYIEELFYYAFSFAIVGRWAKCHLAFEHQQISERATAFVMDDTEINIYINL